MKKILLLEDDVVMSQGIVMAIKSSDVNIVQCYSKKEAENHLNAESFDLAILDINLPDGNGLDLLWQIRQESSMPVIMLTARDTEVDVVYGLESGADDYISKPFSLAILRARVNTSLRRSRQMSKFIYKQDGLYFDFEQALYEKNGCVLEFSKTEQKLLYNLVNNRGMTLSRDRLMELIWSDGTEYVDENALSVAVRRLRAKIEDNPSKPEYIKTVYGTGYRWVTDNE